MTHGSSADVTLFDPCIFQRRVRTAASFQRPAIGFLLQDLQSPINIGQCARVAEIYGIELMISDPRRILTDPSARQTIEDFSCGAWQRRAPRTLTKGRRSPRHAGAGRVVATCLHADAVALPDFAFEHGDLICFGNEYDGLPEDLIRRADARLRIAMPDRRLPKPISNRRMDPTRCHDVRDNGTPSLNVAVAAGIVAYAYCCWLQAEGYPAFSYADPDYPFRIPFMNP